MLLDLLEHRAKELCMKQLILDTLSNQFGAQKLFEKNGYMLKGPAVIDGFNVILYQKDMPNVRKRLSLRSFMIESGSLYLLLWFYQSSLSTNN